MLSDSLDIFCFANVLNLKVVKDKYMIYRDKTKHKKHMESKEQEQQRWWLIPRHVVL